MTRRAGAYRLDEQVGFLLRRASQRHRAIFEAAMPDVTPRQWAALAKLHEAGACSQNRLGRRTAMDAATVKGVVERLVAKDFVALRDDPADGRQRLVELTAAGRAYVDAALTGAAAISQETLAPLGAQEQTVFLALLARLG